jgi:two-component system, NtrC family, response regulator AtoC
VRILVVDDEPDVRSSLMRFLEKLGHDVNTASDGNQGLDSFHSNPVDVLITDLRMPGLDGLELLHRIKRIERFPVFVIVITGHGDMDNAIMALKYGAYDYLRKPINVRELAITLERIEEYAHLKENYSRLKEQFDDRVALETEAVRGEADYLRAVYLEEIGLDGLCVYSQAMRDVVDHAQRFSADRHLSVLIEGESGTGKELIARFIHCYGHGKSRRPFIAINCGAISQELFEGELFGHEPGAYTGATTTGRKGKIEAADGGTIFLDEIAEMPFNMQVKLLRVLEERKISRLGGLKEVDVDVRIISATNKDLQHEVNAKKFRLDLFYRINMGHIVIPALRERPEDIMPLARRFITRACSRKGARFGRFDRSAEDLLTNHPWPGNVRQLKNAMERLALMSLCETVTADDLALVENSGPAGQEVYIQKTTCDPMEMVLPERELDLEALNANIIRRALEKHHGNKTHTARYLRISRRILQGKLKKMNHA